MFSSYPLAYSLGSPNPTIHPTLPSVLLPRSQKQNVLERYHSMKRKVNNLFARFFSSSKLMSRRRVGPAIHQQKTKMLKIKDNKIEETSLAIILERRARRAQAERQERERRVGGGLGDGSSRGMKAVLSQGVRGMVHALSGGRSFRTSTNDSTSLAPGLGIDTDGLSHQVVEQFGEFVDARHNHVAPVHRKRKDTEMLKVKREGVGW